ncbi:hypothetical protein [Globicatella sanguinis]|uniref:hypothetical protein n=1 Tax=Globicatella sanguinis TaxID=13076 RepID=UPI0025439BF7|nr:hypothetical protein [Globicatella sanguinis]MDK7630814.1 hypothetical protein [Globicatella sanguinis]WIK66970.1 hypothetical protein CYJ72_002455 [Globicatella sanguinis]WKT56375.1 hypothetical protein Q3C38_02455 [Globicatella sanguinis]
MSWKAETFRIILLIHQQQGAAKSVQSKNYHFVFLHHQILAIIFKHQKKREWARSSQKTKRAPLGTLTLSIYDYFGSILFGVDL